MDHVQEQQLPDPIVFCEFYKNCKYAEPNWTCLSGGGKYCGTHRTKRYEQKAQRELKLF